MSIAIVVEDKLRADINVSELQIANESHMHSGPATDSHFKLVLVSDDFAGKRLVQRHQMIYKILAAELQSPIHALAMHLYTEEEWARKNGKVMPSPTCQGGSKS
ncbi:BolA family protein [Neptunomonas qingdaonensis]|uniref:BolA protein n=1 Tax=Neptunomonas qingdaonensis TaxID=1045558 RepID=A0A1I2PQP3_9GAMM|nr:BolA/IbaG family iron-sulfur metabolism protein [Neptunomonas qingdaonensis]SFG18368.1 BolA protein [Neptunomonas qingdaonensis]